jgi:hypothetical protein
MDNFILKKGRANLALTIFVPWDCKNNCKFCTIKKEYQNLKMDLDNVLNTLENIFFQDEIHDIVISGGEPLGDIDKFKILIEKIEELNLKSKNIKRVFINTTLPKLSKEDELKFIDIINSNHIYGFNISRHIGMEFLKIDNDLMYDIKKSGSTLRINSVVDNWNDTENEKLEVKNFINFWINYCDFISFRWDYRKVKDMNDLRSFNNNFLIYLNSFLKYDNTFGCLVCNDNYFENGRIAFHRGCTSTLIKFGNNLIVNDIVIKPDGSLYLDWNDYKIKSNELYF